LYLARSDIDTSYTLNKYAQFAIRDLKPLDAKSLRVLIESNSLDKVLEKSIEQNLETLFTLYARVIVLQKEDYSKKFGAYQKTILHFAAINGNLDVLEEILKHKEGRASLSIKDHYVKTPLHYAAEKKNLDVVEEILKHKEGRAALSIKDDARKTPLHLAAAHGNLDLIKAILKHEEGRASLAIQDWYRRTPLKKALQQQYTQIVEEIITNAGQPYTSEIISLVFKNCGLEQIKTFSSDTSFLSAMKLADIKAKNRFADKLMNTTNELDRTHSDDLKQKSEVLALLLDRGLDSLNNFNKSDKQTELTRAINIFNCIKASQPLYLLRNLIANPTVFIYSKEKTQLLEFTAIAAIAYTLSHTSLYSASPDLYKIAVAFIVIDSVCKNYVCRSENDYSIIPYVH